MELDSSGSGSGYGYGDGYGYGSGYGYGDGYGYGYGDGDGDGYGYGDGDGDGDSAAASAYFSELLKPYRTPDATVCFWKSKPDGTPANGGRGTKANVGMVEEIKGPLAICTNKALHGTLNPVKWKGGRWWVVALHHPVQTQEDKVGSLKRTFLADLGKCPFQN